MGNNSLKSFFDLHSFPNLTTLSIFNNQIQSIRYDKLPLNLKTVDAASNKIVYIPESIFYLPNLEYLNLKNNELKNLTGDRIIFDTRVKSNIKFLDISQNNLTMISARIKGMDCRVLNLANNDLIKKSSLKFPYISSLETSCISILGLENIRNLGWKFRTHKFTFCDYCKTSFTNSYDCDAFKYFTIEFMNIQPIISVPILHKFCSLSCKLHNT